MSLSSLTSADLKHLARLLARKESLLSQVAALDAQIEGMGSGSGRGGSRRKAGPGRKQGGKRGKRGALKEAVLAALQKAGKEGLTVKELATQLKRPPANIYTWFFNTGKTVKEVKKVGEAKYAWVG